MTVKLITLLKVKTVTLIAVISAILSEMCVVISVDFYIIMYFILIFFVREII